MSATGCPASFSPAKISSNSRTSRGTALAPGPAMNARSVSRLAISSMPDVLAFCGEGDLPAVRVRSLICFRSAFWNLASKSPRWEDEQLGEQLRSDPGEFVKHVDYSADGLVECVRDFGDREERLDEVADPRLQCGGER